MAAQEAKDRWETLGFFRDTFSDAPPAAVQAPVGRTDIPPEVRVGATSAIWRLARENRRQGGTPRASSGTVRRR